MKRVGVLICAVLALFLISSVNPLAYLIPAAIVGGPFEALFSVAEDGAESSQSLTVFAETSADDTLHYPDTLHNETELIASSGASGDKATGGVGSISNTYTVNGQMWGNSTTEGVGWVRLNFTAPTGYTVDGWSWGLYAWGQVGDEFSNYSVYNWETDTWDYQGDLNLYGSEDWTNGTTYNSAHWQDNECAIILESEDLDSAQVGMVYVDCGVVEFYYMHLADSDHYAESFSSVSDWSSPPTGSYGTDGDVGYYDIPNDGSPDYWYSNEISLPAGSYYVEIRGKDNVSAGTGYGYLGVSSGASVTGDTQTITPVWYRLSDYSTKKAYFTVAWTIACVYMNYVDATNAERVSTDYLRIGPADETGWQHDCSTTSGTDAASSDGDLINVTSSITFDIDTTATAALVETSYYPFLDVLVDDGAGDILAEVSADGSSWSSVVTSTAVSADTHYRGNVLAAGVDVKQVRVNVTSWATLDLCQLGSIANYTVTQSGAGTDDYLYTDSGILYSSIDDGYIELNHDPALSVSDTYPVWNLTTGSTAPQFSDYVSSWSSYSSETRGALQSGTVTDIKLKFTADGDISAIKFIEDGTAPDIIDKFIGPPEPDDSEAVTITAVTYDAVEVYEVTINAVVYPAGFSDVDYDLTEQIDDVLWSYEFSTLTAGYYLFQVTANDGANTYSEYIPIIVRVSAIEISTYTFFGASSDFTYMQYSGHISHDCTYNISEWSTTWAKNETHTGSVTEGMFNIAWDKIGVDDAEANFTIVFVSGTLSLTIEGYYGTAYKALQVTEIDFVNLEQSDSWVTNLTINFYTNKEVDWTVYDRDNDDAVLHSGTTTEGDGFITWVQNTARGAHHFAVKWTDGISDQWYNNSYWVFDRNIDDLPGGADPGADQRRTIEFWATIGGIAGILGIMVIGLSHYNMDEKIKNLPNYRTQGRDRK